MQSYKRALMREHRAFFSPRAKAKFSKDFVNYMNYTNYIVKFQAFNTNILAYILPTSHYILPTFYTIYYKLYRKIEM